MWTETFKSFLSIAIELTVLFVVISFAINLVQAYIPYEKVEKYLSGKNKGMAAAFALIFAFVTPFCSCSTIPVVVNMLKKKMPFSIVMIFLFSSPILDPTIITIMGVVLGWKVSIIYTVITTVFSVIIGFALEAFGFEKSVKNVMVKGYEEETKTFNVKAAFNETLALMKSVYPYLINGALIGSVIHGLVPTHWIASAFGSDKWWIVPIAAIVGIPLYIRLSSMIPISQVLIAKGMALGPVMALIISSAGASLPEVILLKSIFKKELVVTFVLSVIMMSTISGFIFYLV
ncbi:permease [Fictibacillus barbaricus]|uniref:Uncharacterized membrane protein YraQ (UPF0718 family) n=1 Tax=Fictibacillus barbaricus TaxID=182136 RepID=A0ABU1TV37_9BACL|nr:permease [Fictibacillus barbaricus]MDR7071077.1 uncharacterized membrane protein YraQ (UPF0718 family) [Fictibacillus barbaricus]